MGPPEILDPEGATAGSYRAQVYPIHLHFAKDGVRFLLLAMEHGGGSGFCEETPVIIGYRRTRFQNGQDVNRPRSREEHFNLDRKVFKQLSPEMPKI